MMKFETFKVVGLLLLLIVIPSLVEASPLRSKLTRRNRRSVFFPTTTNHAPTVTQAASTGCLVGDIMYLPGQVIDSQYDPFRNHCASTYCNQAGRVIHWENWNCLTTPTPFPTTTATTTTPPTTTAKIM